MTTQFACRACGSMNHAEWSQIGQKVPCGGCGRTMVVPAPMERVGTAEEPAPPLRFACPACGRKYSTKSELAGKKIRCGGCGAGVRVPQDTTASVAQSSRPAMKTYGVTVDATPPPRDRAKRAEVPPEADGAAADPVSLLDDLASIEGVKRPKRGEPVLLSRSELLERVSQQAPEQEATEAPKKRDKADRTGKKGKKKKKSKASSFFDPKETLKLMAGVGAVVGVLAFLAWGYPEFRFPLGGLLCVVGFIVYLLGAASLRQLVAEEGAIKALVYRFCPPYQWWFVLSRWEETKDFFAFFASGLVILSIGGFIIKTSPVGQKAEKSEQAYQKAVKGNRAETPSAVSVGNTDEGE